MTFLIRIVNFEKGQQSKKEQRMQKQEEFRFFALPPNQLESLRKKLNIKTQEITGPSDRQIRTYIQQHSLQYLIYERLPDKTQLTKSSTGQYFSPNARKTKVETSIQPIQPKLPSQRILTEQVENSTPQQPINVASRYRIKAKSDDIKRLYRIVNFQKKSLEKIPKINPEVKCKTARYGRQNKLIDLSNPLHEFMNKLNQTPTALLQKENLIMLRTNKSEELTFHSKADQKKMIANTDEEDYENCFPLKNYILVKQQIRNVQKEKNKKSKKHLRLILKRNLWKLKGLNISPKHLLDQKIFSRKPYEKEYSKEFIHAIKTNSKETIKFYLKKNRYLIFDFDFYNMTGLHWAIKKNHVEIAEYLIQKGSDIDAVDILGRTPLYFAIENCNIEIVKKLIDNGVYLWSTDVTDYKPLLENQQNMKLLISDARKIDIACALSPAKQRKEIWLNFMKELKQEKKKKD